eukprot:gene6470-7757_t
MEEEELGELPADAPVDNTACQIYVGNLSWQATEEVLRAEFEDIGRVVNVKVLIDHETGHNKGYCFITFEDEESAIRAIAEKNGKALEGRSMKVNNALGSNKCSPWDRTRISFTKEQDLSQAVLEVLYLAKEGLKKILTLKVVLAVHEDLRDETGNIPDEVFLGGKHGMALDANEMILMSLNILPPVPVALQLVLRTVTCFCFHLFAALETVLAKRTEMVIVGKGVGPLIDRTGKDIILRPHSVVRRLGKPQAETPMSPITKGQVDMRPDTSVLQSVIVQRRPTPHVELVMLKADTREVGMVTTEHLAVEDPPYTRRMTTMVILTTNPRYQYNPSTV